MPQVTRVGDTGQGVCYAHRNPTPCTVTFTQGNSVVGSGDGKAVLSVGGKGVTSCGHTTTAMTGSSKVFIQGQPVHRVGDTGIIDQGGSYTVVTGHPGTNCN